MKKTRMTGEGTMNNVTTNRTSANTKGAATSWSGASNKARRASQKQENQRVLLSFARLGLLGTRW